MIIQLDFLLSLLQGIDVDSTCSEYENGTALHIAAANLGVSAAQVLLNFGADLHANDDLARQPHDCIPEMHAIDVTLPTDDVEEMITKLKILLHTRKPSAATSEDLLLDHASLGLSSLSINKCGGITTGRSVMNALGLKVHSNIGNFVQSLILVSFRSATEFLSTATS